MGTVTAINIDALVDNDFINWNAAEDEKDATFKERLGILPQIKLHAEEMQRRAEEARLQAEKEAAEKAAKAKEDEKQAAASRAASEEMALVYDSNKNKLSWTYTGKAVNGYKLVYSSQDTEPTFGAKDTQSKPFNDINETSVKAPKGRNYFRVCAYTTAGTCIHYSNTVHVNQD